MIFAEQLVGVSESTATSADANMPPLAQLQRWPVPLSLAGKPFRELFFYLLRAHAALAVALYRCRMAPVVEAMHKPDLPNATAAPLPCPPPPPLLLPCLPMWLLVLGSLELHIAHDIALPCSLMQVRFYRTQS